MATYAFQQINTKQKVSGGQVAFKPKGSNKYIRFGPCPTVEFTPNITEIESFSPEYGDRRLIGSWASGKDGTLNITCESWTELLYQSLFMSEKTYLTQTAETAATFVIEDPAAGDIVKIDGFNPTVASVSDEGGIATYVEDEHYTVHKTGFFELISLPVDASGDVTGTYELPEVTDADKILDLGIMANSGVRGEIVVVGVVADGMPGVETEMTFFDVEIRPSGAVPSINTESLNQATLTARVFATSGRAKGKSYGQMRTLSEI